METERTYTPPNLRIPTLAGYMYDVKMASGQTFTVSAINEEEAIMLANLSMKHTHAVNADYTPKG